MPSSSSAVLETNEPRLIRIGLLASGGLIAFGVVLWIAANWDDLGKVSRFAIDTAVLLTAALAAALSPRLHVPTSLIGIAAIGGLFALIGQTYQTGADPWQLFAFWAVLALPWAFAARHDAVWVLWVVVAYTAFPLWLDAQNSNWTHPASTLLPAWIVAAIPALLLSPLAALGEWLGSTRWSFRLAAVFFHALVLSSALPATFHHSGVGDAAWIGLAVVMATATALTRMRPFDLALLAVCALTLDAQLISLLAQAVLRGPGWDATSGPMFVVAFGSAAIIAASAASVLRIAQSNGFAAARMQGSLWPLLLITTVGALITAIPLLAALGILLQKLITEGAGTYVCAAVLVVGGAWAATRSQPLGFVDQLGIICAVAGLILLGFAVFRDAPVAPASLIMMVIAATLASIVPARWMAAVLGLFAAGFFLVMVAHSLADSRWWMSWSLDIAYHLTAAVAAAAIGLHSRANAALEARLTDEQSARLDHFLVGWSTLALIACALGSGPTFLAGHTLGREPHAVEQSFIPTFNLTLARAIAILMMAGAACWLAFRTSLLQSTAGKAIAGVTAVLCFVMAPLSGPVAILALAASERRRVLSILAAIAMFWVMGSFYYWLGWPLATKAALLVGLGLALGVVALTRPGASSAMTANATLLTASPTLPVLLIVASVIATAGLAATDVWGKEKLIAEGRKVYVALAPVDPRSLMQGDYMALRFALPVVQRNSNNPPRWVSGELNERGLASQLAYAATPDRSAPGRIVMQITYKNGFPVLASDAYFFKEGTAERYAAARFGEFRVADDGTVLLVGLADEDLRRID